MTTPFDVLTRIRSNRPPPEPEVERCEMCAETIADEHQHVVNVAARQLMCVCRACYLLFTDGRAELRYRAVPDRYLSFPDFALDRLTWEALQIPVGVVLDRVGSRTLIATGAGLMLLGQVTLAYADWQRILAIQMVLARYSRAVAEPDALLE